MSNLQQTFASAVDALNAGRLADAEKNFKAVLKESPGHAGALNLLTITLMNMGRHAEAESYIQKAVSINRKSDVSFYNYGLILSRLGRNEEAIKKFDKSIELNPSVADTWNNRGLNHLALQDSESALNDFQKALSINPLDVAARINEGRALQRMRLYDEALAAYEKAATLNPNLPELWHGRGSIYLERRHLQYAFQCFDRAIALNPNFGDAYFNRGLIYVEMKNHRLALNDFERTIALNPEHVGAYLGGAHACRELKRSEDALAFFDKALALDPNQFGMVYEAKMAACIWSTRAADKQRIIDIVADATIRCDPFTILGLFDSPSLQMQAVARVWAASKSAGAAIQPFAFSSKKRPKIRIGYFSADFYDHAVMALLIAVLERHHREEFEFHGFSIGAGPLDDQYLRAKAAFDSFVDLRAVQDSEIVTAARDAQLDIAIDLNGYTRASRPEIFFPRVAPLQVNYLGYPGTMAAPCMDYLIADPTLAPESNRKYYSEKIVFLPYCYQPNDNGKAISDRQFSRSECGLPDRGFVFCCFNNNWKITPDVFDIWMRILTQVEGSVLWLLQDNDLAAKNLRKEAVARGVDENRLIFAPRMPAADHLARHRLADLFLDTLPYNAHTTGSDALWVGTPLLTCVGEAFAARVAASLLNAIGLPELITRSMAEYEVLAVELATNQERQRALKIKLAGNRLTQPLFNTDLYTRHLESAYKAMVERRRAGLDPDHIFISP